MPPTLDAVPPTLDAAPPTLDAVPPTLDPPVSTDARRRHTHVTPAQVLLLQSVRAYPAVSLLLSTTPAPVMGADDRERLLGLLDQALARLRAEGLAGAEATLVPALQAQVTKAINGPTSAAIGVFASQAVRSTVRLSVPVIDRVVLDPTFATRDLVRSLHHTPRHVVLLLERHQALLFDGVGATLRPAVRSAFPLSSDADGRHAARQTSPHAFLARVDRGLGAYLRLHPAPLVLAGDDDLISRFRAMSRNVNRLVSTLPLDRTQNAPEADLPMRIGPLLTAYLRSREAEALALLDERARSHRVVSGIDDVWLAARRGRPEMLAVEFGHFYPARLSPDGDALEAATDVDHPDVLDDAVDELIEMVIDRGGWVALVEDGALAAHQRVALTVRA
jgi:hypothetical protein